jgi:hypothetical protein
LQECKQFKVNIIKPKDQEAFLESLEGLQISKKKAINMLFEEIEADVNEKDRFVTLQVEKLREMAESYQTMLDYEKVLFNV